ncbi:hypothetical protein DH2020_016594 [Rehmannia glutinosa]|uniref:BHLH domain-containing protein n=1 Tax=Rehmannia glutinosa TaxID=99300 RepID=A0ABR0WS04_REHGL
MAASPSHICSLGWLLEDPISHEQENFNYLNSLKTETSNSINDLHYSPSSTKIIQPENDESMSFHNEFRNGDNDKIVKKMNHNAIERHRRQRINTLFSTLKSLLPPQDHSRKLSIPATVSRALKYIPELQKEVERLSKEKESLMSSKISRVEKEYSLSFGLKNKRIKVPNQTNLLSSATISTTPISDREIVIQSSMPKAEKRALSEAVMSLEQQGFLTVNGTCFESFEGRVFYNLHLQAQGSQVPMDVELLKKKVWQF